MSHYHLAQVNIAKALAPLDQPLMQGFVEQLDRVNALADAHPGFVWRLQTEDGDATSVQAFDDPLLLVNLSVWQGFEALKDYVYSGEHLQMLRGKKQWFEKSAKSPLALWWVPAGHLPDVLEARQKIEQLWRDGPSAAVFSFAQPFPAPDAVAANATE
ncbi:DUF3291 domain-containing protein [Chitinimonas sp.]|uniref:DUF3291 domain-containing protein n=1 Tax=Chitinimonas sp. TaxID=1934313 RepID=UPI0035B274CB